MLLTHLTTFARVVESGSFTRAGELLNLSQPAVTRQVAALEQEFGGTLLERNGRHLHLTARGQVVYQTARRMLAQLETCRADLAELEHPDRGTVAVAAVTTIGLFTLPALMAEFNQKHPSVRFRLWSGRVDGVLERVLEGECDLALVTSPLSHPRLACIPLFEDPVVLVGARELAAGLPSLLPPDLLAQQQLIFYQAPSRFRTLVDAALEQAGVVPQVAMELESHEAVRTMVLGGYGLALVPRCAVESELQAGLLREVKAQGLTGVSRTTCLLLRRDDGPRPQAVEKFLELLLERYGVS